MTLSRRIGRSAGLQVGGRLYTSLLAFVITAVIVPRLLDERGFGVFAFHLALYQLLANVLDFGAGTIVVRDAARDRASAGRLIGQLITLKAVFASAGVLLLAGVALVFEEPGLRLTLLLVAALHLLFHAPGGATAIFHVDMAFGRHVLALVLGQTAWMAGTFLLAALGVTEPGYYLLAFALGPVVNGLLGYLWASRRVAIVFDATRQELSRLWQEVWPAGVSMTMASVYFYIDTLMLRPMAGEVAVAHYSAAYRLMTFVLMVPVLFSQVVFPVFSRLWVGGPERLTPFFRRTLRFLFAVGAVFPATVPFVAHDVMRLVYPPVYVEGADALAVLSLAILLVFCAYPHVLTLLAAGRQKEMMFISMLGAALNVGLNLWWIPRFGIEGSAWATVATEGFVVLAAAATAARCTGVRLRFAELLRPAACALAAAGVLAALGGEAHFLFAAGVAAVALLGSGVLPLDLGTEEAA